MRVRVHEAGNGQEMGAVDDLAWGEAFGRPVDGRDAASLDVEVVAADGVAVAGGEHGERISYEQTQGNLLNRPLYPPSCLCPCLRKPKLYPKLHETKSDSRPYKCMF